MLIHTNTLQIKHFINDKIFKFMNFFENLIFLIFLIFLILCSILAISTKNIIYSILYLILSFLIFFKL